MLIGFDHYWDIITNESIRADSGPTAVNSKLAGFFPVQQVIRHLVERAWHLIYAFLEHHTQSMPTTNLNYWEDFDSIGIKNDHDAHKEKLIESEIVQLVFNDEDNHYEVSLPWKEDYLPSLSNYRLCEKRLKMLLHCKLKNESNLLNDYHQIIKDQEMKGVVERVDESINPANQSPT